MKQYHMKLIRLPEACSRIPDGYTFIYRLVLARGHPRLAILFYTVCPRPRLSTVGYSFLYRLPSPEAIHGWLCFYIPFALARGYPRFPFGSTATLASKAYIHGLI